MKKAVRSLQRTSYPLFTVDYRVFMAESTSTSAPKRRENLEAIVAVDSPYHVQNWYPLLKAHTFATVFIPLSVELAQALTNYKDKTITDDAEKSLARKFAPKVPLETRKLLESQLEAVSELIDSAKASLSGAPSGMFVRLSSRSPKDLISIRLYDSYSAEMKREVAQGSSESDPVLQKIVFTRASGLALRTVDGKEAVALLVNSQRVYEDLAMSLKIFQQSPGSKWTQELVVRRWENILQEWEFRAFIFGGKFTACTQYNVGLYVPLLVAKKDEIQARIQRFWQESIDPIFASQLPHYVVDFAVDPFSEKIWVVEINNPPPVAGTALFDWNDPTDREIIEKGPFEFRILESIPDDPMKNQRDWLKTMEARNAQQQAKAAGAQATKKKRLSF